MVKLADSDDEGSQKRSPVQTETPNLTVIHVIY